MHGYNVCGIYELSSQSTVEFFRHSIRCKGTYSSIYVYLCLSASFYILFYQDNTYKFDVTIVNGRVVSNDTLCRRKLSIWETKRIDAHVEIVTRNEDRNTRNGKTQREMIDLDVKL